jgi:hypothetical protein
MVNYFIRVLDFIFILLIINLLMTCNRKTDVEKEEVEVIHVVVQSEEDCPEPPPPGFTSQFKTVQEWLFNICDTDKPGKSITTYNFGLFEVEEDYIVFIVGLNTYNTGQYSSATRIDFAPSSMYFSLPKSEYKNLNREHVLERLTTQLKDFTKTDTFRHSFFALATSLTTDFKGEIWTK